MTVEPWKVMCDEARGKPRCLVVDKKENQIAEVNPYRESWNEDAKAIAAVPVLLAALRHIVKHQDMIGGSMGAVSSTRRIAAMAIQHATGEVV